MKRAAILVRVSTDVQQYQRQISELQAKAKRDGYVVEDRHIFAEKVSGFSPLEQRRELTRLLADIRDKKTDIKIIYCSELSRISRNPRIARQVIDEACDLGIPFFIEGIGKTLEDDGSRNMTTSIVIQVFAEYAAKEAAITKIRSKSGKRDAAKAGKWGGGAWVPFGYSVEPGTKLLIINKEEAKVVKQIFQMCIDGLGTKNISTILNDRGILSRSGKHWTEVVVHQMLENPLYFGTRKWKDELFPGMPNIITEESWRKAREAAATRNVNPARNVKYLYLLDGKLICGCCGKKYCAKYVKRKNSNHTTAEHYMCYNRKFLLEKCCNAGVGISQIESLVWSVVGNKKLLSNYLKNQSAERQKAEVEMKRLSLEKDSLNSELLEKEKEKERWFQLFVKQKVSEQRFDQESEKLEKSILNLQARISSILETIQVKQKWSEKLNDVKQYQKEIENISTDRRVIKEIMDKVLEKVIINSVTKNSNSRYYIVSIFAYGGQYTYWFDKKEMIKLGRTGLIGKYNEKEILLNFKELVKLVATPIPRSEKWIKAVGGRKDFGLTKKIPLIPFTMINVYKDMLRTRKQLETV